MTIFGSRDPWEIAESIPDEYEPGQSGLFGILKQKPYPTLTHEHNPILPAFRAYCAEYRYTPVKPAAEMWSYAFLSFDAFGGFELWNHAKNTYHSLTLATPSQIAHARRVIDRLAGWQQ